MKNKNNEEIKKRAFYHLKIFIAVLAAAAILAVGSTVIHVNCYNAMNSTPITIFE